MAGRAGVTLDDCRKWVTVDLEWEMGITQALQGEVTEEAQEIIAEARQVLEPVIEKSAEDLYRWHHR